MNSRWLYFIALASSCATTQLRSDVRQVEQLVVDRGQLGSFSLPRFEQPDELSEQVDALLAKPLTADDAARVALLANRDARAALAEVGIARGTLLQAGLLPNPEVELGVRAPGGPQPAQLDLGLEYNLSAAIIAPARASVAEATLEATRLEAAGALLDLIFETKLAYYEVQAASQRLELRLRFLESQQASYGAAEALSKAGNIPELTLANELASVELARLQVAEAENALVDAREALNRKMGLFGSRTRWSIAGPLRAPPEEAPMEEPEKRAVSANLELVALERRAEAARRKVGLSSLEGWLPHLSGGFHGERDADLWELGMHITVGLPVFDRAQGRRLSAQSEYDAWRSRAEASAVALRSTVRATLNRVESASKRARHVTERLLPARQRQLEQTVLQYNAMTLGVFEVLAVQRSVTETAVVAVETQLDYWRARAALDLILAGRTPPIQRAMSTSSRATAPAAAAGH